MLVLVLVYFLVFLLRRLAIFWFFRCIRLFVAYFTMYISVYLFAHCTISFLFYSWVCPNIFKSFLQSTHTFWASTKQSKAITKEKGKIWIKYIKIKTKRFFRKWRQKSLLKYLLLHRTKQRIALKKLLMLYYTPTPLKKYYYCYYDFQFNETEFFLFVCLILSTFYLCCASVWFYFFYFYFFLCQMQIYSSSPNKIDENLFFFRFLFFFSTFSFKFFRLVWVFSPCLSEMAAALLGICSLRMRNENSIE